MAESPDKSNPIIAIGDQPTTDDKLGFTPYVIAIAEFLTNDKTKPPLTLSIEGEWGSGKSSFMRQLEAEIIKKAEDLEKEKLSKFLSDITEGKPFWRNFWREKNFWYSDVLDWLKFLQSKFKLKQKTQIIEFNAWRHDKAESLWAAFALSFLEQISTNRYLSDILPNLFSNLKLLSYRFNPKTKPFKFVQTVAITSLIASIVAAIPIVYFQVGFEGVSQWSENIVCLFEEKESTNECSGNLPLTILLIIGGTGGTFAGIGKLLATLRDLIGDPKMDLTQYLESPDYDKQVAFIEKFHDDFSKIVRAYAGKDEKVYVFIDDLDRCELGKSADLLQALNLMISNDPNIIFILGMDREKVAAAITFRQKDILPYVASVSGSNQDNEDEKDNSLKNLDYGFSFMEKFVQLSFRVPQASQTTLDKFLEEISAQKQENRQKDFFWTPAFLFILKTSNYIQFQLKKFLPNPIKLAENETTQNRPQGNRQVNELPDLDIFPILEKDLTSESLANLMEMVAPFFDYNPRRLKQYINVLRLRTYIAYYAIGAPFKENVKITREQIGKFIAITLKYHRLLFELNNKDNNLLAKLENYALNKSLQSNNSNESENNQSTLNNQQKGNASYWVNNYPKLETLLCYGLNQTSESSSNDEENYNRYSLKNESITKLLIISSPLSSINLPSQFFPLREFLANEEWREANQETANLMIQLKDKDGKGYLNIEDCQNFPEKELRIIDQLWVKCSGRKFGFSVQKQIYLDKCNGKLDTYNRETYKAYRKMADLVGWRENDQWLSYSKLTFKTTAKRGHLPVVGKDGDWELWMRGERRGACFLFSRL